MSADVTPEHVRQFFAGLRAKAEGWDADELHALLMTDPSTGDKYVLGPYADRAAAEADIAPRQEEDRRVHDEPMPTYEPVVFFHQRDVEESSARWRREREAGGEIVKLVLRTRVPSKWLVTDRETGEAWEWRSNSWRRAREEG